MVEKKKLMGMTLAELQQVAAEVGLPGYTAKQMADWLYKKHITEVSEMTNVALAKRSALAERYEVGAYPPAMAQRSVDGTIKYLYAAGEGHFVESVYIPYGGPGDALRFLAGWLQDELPLLHDR